MSPLLKQLLLPPGSLLVLLLVGLFILRRRQDVGWWIAMASAATLFVLATPLGSGTLSRVLETIPPLTAADLRSNRAQAIVILGGDGGYDVEPGGDTVGSLTLARLHYGAWLHAQTGLPILVSGGVLEGDDISLAVRMKQTLAGDYGISDVWVETRSRNTWENAVDSAVILRANNIEQFFLVTHARDMPRALDAFQRTGLHVVAAPMAFDERRADGLRNLSPSAKSLLASYYSLYEIAGGIQYALVHPKAD